MFQVLHWHLWPVSTLLDSGDRRAISTESSVAWCGCTRPVPALSQSLVTSFLELPLSENAWLTVSLSLSLWGPWAEVWDSVPQAGVAPTLTPAPKCQSLRLQVRGLSSPAGPGPGFPGGTCTWRSRHCRVACQPFLLLSSLYSKIWGRCSPTRLRGQGQLSGIFQMPCPGASGVWGVSGEARRPP